jgi:hypothetical protein
LKVNVGPNTTGGEISKILMEKTSCILPILLGFMFTASIQRDIKTKNWLKRTLNMPT